MLAIFLVLAGCGGEKKTAEQPQNAEETPAAASVPSAAEPTPTPSTTATVAGDDTEKPPAACSGGVDIPDLLSVISQAACEAPDVKPDGPEKDMKDALELKMSVDPANVAPGAHAQVTIAYKNKGKKALALYFVVDPEPRFDFETLTLKGKRMDNPSAPAPALPPEVTNSTVAEPKVARVTLAPQGTAKLTLKWDAVKYKWVSQRRAKGAPPGHGYPREPAGPLPRGKYVLRVVTPLTGVADGEDHEISRPKTPVVVGGR
jgi:hypothetical protein